MSSERVQQRCADRIGWRLDLAAGVLAFLAAAPAWAILAGALPDTPAARVDPNTTASPWAGVGSLSVGSGVYTATAIHPRYVLTAAHVVKGAAVSSIRFNLNFGGDLTYQIPAAAVFVHPNYVSFNNPNLQHDIAIVQLAQNIPVGVPIYALLGTEVAAGTRITLVGYGASGRGDVGVNVGGSATAKRKGDNNADQFDLDAGGSGRKAIFYFDFDGGSAASVIGGASLGNTIETTLAGGDSGSPSFVLVNATPAVAAVNTFVVTFEGGPTAAGVFGTGGGGNLVFAYHEWIESILSRPLDNQVSVPVPGWALALLGALLIVAGMRARGRTTSS